MKQIKELTTKEVAQMLIDNDMNPVKLLAWDDNILEAKEEIIRGIVVGAKYPIATERYFCTHAGVEIEVESEYVPYDSTETPPLKIGEEIVEKASNVELQIIGIDRREDTTSHVCVASYKDGWIDNAYLFYNYTKEDGSPIGKIDA